MSGIDSGHCRPKAYIEPGNSILMVRWGVCRDPTGMMSKPEVERFVLEPDRHAAITGMNLNMPRTREPQKSTVGPPITARPPSDHQQTENGKERRTRDSQIAWQLDHSLPGQEPHARRIRHFR